MNSAVVIAIVLAVAVFASVGVYLYTHRSRSVQCSRCGMIRVDTMSDKTWSKVWTGNGGRKKSRRRYIVPSNYGTQIIACRTEHKWNRIGRI